MSAEVAGGSAGSALSQVRVEAWKALGAAISGAPRGERDEAWKAVLAVLSVLGAERIEGWKAVAAGLGVSVTRARELALPTKAFRLPVRYGPRGVYMTRLALALWLAEYSAPHGAHAELKRGQRRR